VGFVSHPKNPIQKPLDLVVDKTRSLDLFECKVHMYCWTLTGKNILTESLNVLLTLLQRCQIVKMLHHVNFIKIDVPIH